MVEGEESQRAIYFSSYDYAGIRVRTQDHNQSSA